MNRNPKAKFTFEYTVVTHHVVQADTEEEARELLRSLSLEDGDYMHIDMSAIWDEAAEEVTGEPHTIYLNPDISIDKRRTIELPRGI
jgi:hypothetical protein